jgi:hypothetical protein
LRLGGWGRRLSYNTFWWGCDTRLFEIGLQSQIPKLLKTFSRGLGSVLIIQAKPLEGVVLSLLTLQSRSVIEHSDNVLSMRCGLSVLWGEGPRCCAEWRLSAAAKVQTVHEARDILVTHVAHHVHTRTNGSQTGNHARPESILYVAGTGNTGPLCRRWLVAAWRCDATKAWLAMQAMSTGVVLKLVWHDTTQLS